MAGRTNYALAVDIGGTNIKFALIDHLGKVHGDITKHPVPFNADRVANVNDLLDIMQSYVEQAIAYTGNPQIPLGMSICGNIDEDTGEAVLVANLRWHNVPFGAAVRERFGLPVALATDVRLAALAEHVWGIARGVQNFFWLTIGTGYGGHLVLNGRLYGGQHGFAGNIGHTPLDLPDGRLCGCGHYGCIETYVAGPAIARAGQRALDEGHSPALRQLAVDSVVTPQMVFQAEQEGDPAACEIIDTLIRRVSINLAGVVNLLDLEMLILGGGVISGVPSLVPRISTRIRDYVMTVEARRDLRVERESLPNSALFGAAANTLIKHGLLAVE